MRSPYRLNRKKRKAIQRAERRSRITTSRIVSLSESKIIGGIIASGCITPGLIQAHSTPAPDGELARLTDETIRALSTRLPDGSVLAGKIADGAVSEGRLADGSVGEPHRTLFGFPVVEVDSVPQSEIIVFGPFPGEALGS